MDIGLLIVGIALVLFSIPLYFGKLTNLIAGYNSLSAKEKAKINEKKLAISLAITFDITAIVAFVGSFKLFTQVETFLYCIAILIVGIGIGNSKIIKK